MVQTLNLILLTSAELFDLRALIKRSLFTEQGRDLFIALYKSWCHNPVSTFSLCLMAQAYELASALVFPIAEIEVTVSFLMQVDKLVQLVESPIFIHLRLQLLEPHRYPFLLKSLYGLLMLLPQSPAFTSLKTRMDSVSTLSMLNMKEEPSWSTMGRWETEEPIPTTTTAATTTTTTRGGNKPSKPSQGRETQSLNFKELLKLFQETQEKHQAKRRLVHQQKSLLYRGRRESKTQDK